LPGKFVEQADESIAGYGVGQGSNRHAQKGGGFEEAKSDRYVTASDIVGQQPISRFDRQADPPEDIDIICSTLFLTSRGELPKKIP
jgi:hypothetical protein